jgi:hypothetical protein
VIEDGGGQPPRFTCCLSVGPRGVLAGGRDEWPAIPPCSSPRAQHHVPRARHRTPKLPSGHHPGAGGLFFARRPVHECSAPLYYSTRSACHTGCLVPACLACCFSCQRILCSDALPACLACCFSCQRILCSDALARFNSVRYAVLIGRPTGHCDHRCTWAAGS